jgi:hypothetical protein
MTADQQPPPPAIAEPILLRWGTCAIGGAIAGIVVGGWGIACEQADILRQRGTTLPDFIDEQIALGRFWEYLHAWRILGPALPGVVGGLLSALFSRRMRQPFALASVWASILGTIALALIAMLMGFGEMRTPRPTDMLVNLAVFLTSGAIYGFVLGVSARLLERGLQRLRRPPAS